MQREIRLRKDPQAPICENFPQEEDGVMHEAEEEDAGIPDAAAVEDSEEE